jgi:PTS system nitrogen regulatory IIA component
MPHTRFNLKEAADYLHVSEGDLSLLVKRSEVPHQMVANRPVFVRGELDVWASQRLLGFAQRNLEDYHRRSSAKMHDLSRHSAIVSELLKPTWIEPELNARTKSSVLRDMIDRADATGLLNDRAGLLHSMIEREKLCSTALSGGVAILHGQHHEPYQSEDSFLVLGRTVQPIPFGAPDGKNTDIFFLMCCQDNRIHLHVLARICMLCHQTPLLGNLRECATADDMHAAILTQELETIRGL